MKYNISAQRIFLPNKIYKILKRLERKRKNPKWCLFGDEPRSGTPAKFTPEQITCIIAVAWEDPQESDRPISHWTARELALEGSTQYP